MQRLVVHPADHEHLAGVPLLGDGDDEAVLVALEPRGELRVQGVGHRDILAHAVPRHVA